MTTPDDTQLLDLIPPEAEIVRRIIEEVRQYPRIRRPLLRFLAADDFDELIDAVKENSDNIKLILDRMGVVETRIGAMDDRLTSVDERLTGVDERLTGVDERLTGVDERLTGVEGRLTGVEGRLTGVEGRLTGVEGRLTGVEGRLTSLEHTVQDTNVVVRSLQGSVGQLRGDSYENACAGEIDALLDGYLEFAVLADREKIRLPFLDGRRNGQISREEYLDSYRPDIIARATHDENETEHLAVVEVSITCNRDDLESARRRADLIGRVTGVPTSAYLVPHHQWPPEMDRVAHDLGVTIIRNEHPQYAYDV